MGRSHSQPYGVKNGKSGTNTQPQPPESSKETVELPFKVLLWGKNETTPKLATCGHVKIVSMAQKLSQLEVEAQSTNWRFHGSTYTQLITREGADVWSVTPKFQFVDHDTNGEIGFAWKILNRSNGLRGKLVLDMDCVDMNSALLISEYFGELDPRGVLLKPYWKLRHLEEKLEKTLREELLCKWITRHYVQKLNPTTGHYREVHDFSCTIAVQTNDCRKHKSLCQIVPTISFMSRPIHEQSELLVVNKDGSSKITRDVLWICEEAIHYESE
jgi:hypothetical protein